MTVITICAMTLLAVSRPAEAVDYYVSPAAGADDNPGTKAGHRTYQRFQPSDVFGQPARTASHADAGEEKVYTILGAKASDLDTEEKKSLAGVGVMSGVYVLDAPRASVAARAGMRAGDAILAVDGKSVANCKALLKVLAARKGKTIELHVVGATDRKLKVKVE